jgi:hypothetical protein
MQVAELTLAQEYSSHELSDGAIANSSTNLLKAYVNLLLPFVVDALNILMAHMNYIVN